MRAFLFPGQGSQYPAMGLKLYNHFPQFKKTFDEIEYLCNIDLKSLIFNGTSETLTKTHYAQISIFTISLSILSVLKEKNIQADFYLGHSLGEITSYVASGILSLKDGVEIVLERGKLMAEEGAKQKASMWAVLGVPLNEIESVLSKFLKDSNYSVYIANINSKNQLILSSLEKDFEEFQKYLLDQNCRWKMIKLKVSGAFHSPLLKKAENLFFDFLKSKTFNKSFLKVYSNFTSDIIKENEYSLLSSYLSKQLTHKVHWLKMFQGIMEKGVSSCIEIGPSSVLTKLAKKMNSNVSALETDSIEAIESLKNYN